MGSRTIHECDRCGVEVRGQHQLSTFIVRVLAAPDKVESEWITQEVCPQCLTAYQTAVRRAAEVVHLAETSLKEA